MGGLFTPLVYLKERLLEFTKVNRKNGGITTSSEALIKIMGSTFFTASNDVIGDPSRQEANDIISFVLH